MMKLTGQRFRVVDGPFETVLSAVEQTTNELGFLVGVHLTAQESAVVLARCCAPWRWRRIFTRNPLQKIRWTIQRDHRTGAILLTFDPRWFLAYRLIVLMLAVPIGWMWSYGFVSAFQAADSPETLSLRALLLPFLGMCIMILYARHTFSSHSSMRYVEDLRRNLREHGLSLDALPNTALDRTRVSGIVFLVYITVVTAPILFHMNISFPISIGGFPMLLLGAIGLLLGLLCAMLLGLFVTMKYYGAGDRFAPIAPSLNGMIAIIFFLAGQVGLPFYGLEQQRRWTGSVQEQEAVTYEAPGSPMGIIGQPRTHDGVRLGTIKPSLAIIPLGILAGAWMLGLGFVMTGLRSAHEAHAICLRLQTDVAAESVRTSTSGAGFLVPFRAGFVGIWVIYILLAIGGVTSLVSLNTAPINTLAAGDSHDRANVTVQGMVAAIAALSGASPSGALRAGVRAFLIIWVLVLPVAVVLSVADGMRRRHRMLRRVRRGRRITEISSSEKPVSWIHDLATLGDQPNLDVIVTTYPGPLAMAHGGILASDRAVIEISETTVGLLEPAELKALVAHELAHHVCGHCSNYSLWIWLGRLTLVGDTFVGALTDSFGYEIEADRIAIEQFGIPSSDLRSALLKMQVATIVGSGARAMATPAKSFKEKRESTGGSSRTNFRRIPGLLGAWLALYTGDPPLAYWHPSVRERLRGIAKYECRSASDLSKETNAYDHAQ